MLSPTSRLEFKLSNLRTFDEVDVTLAFNDPQAAAAWRTAEPKLHEFPIPDGTGGVNPGDRRAIFYLVRHLRARSVLEIGTHIGASTTHVASALHSVEGIDGASVQAPIRLDTVDVLDVNDPATRPWLNYNTRLSPREMITLLRLDRFVQFFTQPSVQYMELCARKYDMIFLDGDHAEPVVYEEISRALELLNPGGMILLHDYFPDMRPLWSSGTVIPGPCAAVHRMQQEGARVRAIPLGELPWPTKYGSSATSLAILAATPE